MVNEDSWAAAVQALPGARARRATATQELYLNRYDWRDGAGYLSRFYFEGEGIEPNLIVQSRAGDRHGPEFNLVFIWVRRRTINRMRGLGAPFCQATQS
jgi:hypothetical protein